MRMSWIKGKNDDRSFRVQKSLGLDVFEIEDLEKTDEKIGELVSRKYDTIVLSNEVASFSGDIINKYVHDDSVNIIIARNKKEY